MGRTADLTTNEEARRLYRSVEVLGLGEKAMKRLDSAEEVVSTVAFLLSDESSYTTGTNLIVAGGLA